MLSNSLRLPFEIPDIDYGLRKADGLLRIDKSMLVLEYRIKDGLFGVLKSDIEEVRIPLRDLDSVEFKKKLFSGRFTIYGRSMQALEEVPGEQGTMVELKVKRRNRKTAQRLASQVQLQLSELRLDEMSGDEGQD